MSQETQTTSVLEDAIWASTAEAATTSEEKKYEFANSLAKAFYLHTRIEDEVRVSHHQSVRVTEDFNTVLLISENYVDYSCEILTEAMIRGKPEVREVLKSSWKVTVGKQADDFDYSKDKVLEFMESVDLEKREEFEQKIAYDGVCVFVYTRNSASDIVVMSKSIKRVVRSLLCVQFLGGDAKMVVAVKVVGTKIGWTKDQLEIDPGLENRRQRPSRNGQDAQISIHSNTVRLSPQSYCVKVGARSWRTLVEVPDAFTMLFYRAGMTNQSIIMRFAYLCLSASSQLVEDSGSRLTQIFPLPSLRIDGPDLSIFGCWVLACICAEWLSYNCAQSVLSRLFFGQSVATEIFQNIRRIRNLNRKIVKHVFHGALLKNPGEAIIDMFGQALFNELSPKWKALFRAPSTDAFKALEQYLKNFRLVSTRFNLDSLTTLLQVLPTPKGERLKGTWKRFGGLYSIERLTIRTRDCLDHFRKIQNNCRDLMIHLAVMHVEIEERRLRASWSSTAMANTATASVNGEGPLEDHVENVEDEAFPLSQS